MRTAFVSIIVLCAWAMLACGAPDPGPLGTNSPGLPQLVLTPVRLDPNEIVVADGRVFLLIENETPLILPGYGQLTYRLKDGDTDKQRFGITGALQADPNGDLYARVLIYMIDGQNAPVVSRTEIWRVRQLTWGEHVRDK